MSLVDTEWLEKNINQVKIIDCSWHMPAENRKLSGKVVTKISAVKNYCPAEEYHQKYLEKR